MIRLIKRYESRKLYDTEESRYVSLEEIASWVREGQEVRVIDNATGGDVTSQTLTQIILDEGRRGTSSLPSELLHELVRLGERAVHSGVEQGRNGADRLGQASIDRLPPGRRARGGLSGGAGRAGGAEGRGHRLRSLRDRLVEKGRPIAERHQARLRSLNERADRGVEGAATLLRDTAAYESRQLLRRFDMATTDDLPRLAASPDPLERQLEEDRHLRPGPAHGSDAHHPPPPPAPRPTPRP